MERFGPSHLAALAVTAGAAALLVALVRGRSAGDPGLRRARRGLALAMLVSEVGLLAAVYALDGVRPASNLPLHLTHWAWLMCVIALWSARTWAFELAWFWAGAAVTQAMVTPSLSHDFPDVRYWQFMAVHAPVLAGVVFLAFGCGLTPRAGAVWRAWFAGWGVFAVAATASLVTGGNYMFAREPPFEGSLLDLMGPWPWYLGAAALVAPALFWLLDLPFRGRRNRAVERPALTPR